MVEENRVFRPRLTLEEVLFITQALKSYREFMKEKQEDMERTPFRIRDLSIKLHNEGVQHLPELKHERQQYAIDKQQNYSSQMLVADILLRRFKALSEGGRLHSAITTHIFLNE